MAKILIVDDERNVLSSFKKILTQDGHEISTASSAEEGLSMAKSGAIDLLIMDIRMPGMDGLEAFCRFREIDPKTPVIIMTAYGTTETTIEAMKLGAYDYVLKPFEVPRMKRLIERALEAGRVMKTEVTFEPKQESRGDRIIGSSPKMQQIYKTIGQVAASDMTVLLRGESGTGKELIARAIYHHSHRKDKRFLVMNSAAIPETLLESEIFGYEKGAFTDARERRIGKFEQASGGTVFLDEIGDMPASIQTKILRVLEHKSFERLGGNKTIKVDVRLLAATNRDLEVLMREGKFREDLYYRLNVITINIPPLREHKEDIPQLAEYFLHKYGRELNRNVSAISAEASGMLQSYDWPGNIRELENVVKKTILFAKESIIQPEHIAIPGKFFSKDTGSTRQLEDLLARFVRQGLQEKGSSLYRDIVEETEKIVIAEALKQLQGNQSRAARVLGVSRPTLKDKIEKFGLRKIVRIEEGEE